MERPGIKEKETTTFSERFGDFCNKWVPNSMVFVFGLTLLVAVLAVIICKAPILNSTETATSVIDGWVQGFWKLLQFSMQMSLIIITGFVLASSPPVKKILEKIAKIPNSQISAIILIGIVSGFVSWLHWGMGMMFGMILGREVLGQAKKRGFKIHKNSFVAAIYANMTLCYVGVSHAAALFAASPGFLKSLVTEESAALMANSIPLSETLLTPVVVIQIIVLSFAAIATVLVMTPKDKNKIEEISEEFANEIQSVKNESKIENITPAQKIENSPVLNIFIGFMGMYWSIKMLVSQGIVGISINNFNFFMLTLGVLLCWTPTKFIQAVRESMDAIWGIVIQFPFYAGIFGIITFTGLNHVIAEWFVSISTANMFPWIAYVYSAVLNFFVPSGGSKFIIEAPYLIPASQQVGAELPKVLNAYAFGDSTTNLIQPFWALPYLAMFKIKFKDILPYGFIISIVAFLITSFFILVLY